MCQTTPLALYTRWEHDSETKRFTARQNHSRPLEYIVPSYFQQSQPDCKIGSNVTTGRQKKVDCFSVGGLYYHCNTLYEAMDCYFHYCPCQEVSPSFTYNEVMKGIEKKEQDQMRKEYIQQKRYKIIEMWECNWWELYRTDASVKSCLRENFPYKRPLSEE